MNHRFSLSIILCIALVVSCGYENRLQNDALERIHEGQFTVAIEHYIELVAKDGDNPVLLNNLGWSYFKNNKLKQAVIHFNQALALPASDNFRSRVRLNLNMTRAFQHSHELMLQKSFQAALDTLNRIADSFQTKEIGNEYIALCHEGLGESVKAREYWEKTIDYYVDSAVRNHFYYLAKEKMIGIANNRIACGDLNDALAIFQLLLSVEPDNPALKNYMAWAMFRNEEWRKAEKLLGHALEITKSKAIRDSIETNLFMVTTFLAGDYSLDRKEYNAALTEFEKVTKRYKPTDMSLKYLALCYEGQKRTDLAYQCWKQIIDMYENQEFLNEYSGEPYENKYYNLAVQKLDKLKVY